VGGGGRKMGGWWGNARAGGSVGREKEEGERGHWTGRPIVPSGRCLFFRKEVIENTFRSRRDTGGRDGRPNSEEGGV